jgi:ABC-type branched-subunit amino acid transport system substrate-binding protein
VALAGAACGLSPGAASDLQRAATSGSLGSSGLSGSAASGTSSGGAGTSNGSGPGGGSGSSATASPTGTVPGGGAGGGSGGGGGTGGGSGGGAYETIGITATTINLGIHAPATGAAPVPLQAFQTGTKLFWENHTVFGHQVVMTFMDDQYSPSTARQVCESLARSNFLVIGGAGTDQIQACATDPFLAQSHTPYLSDGVTTNGLTSLPYYFAISQSYAAQSGEVFAMTSQLYPADVKKKWAVVTENTPNFADAQASIDQVLTQNGVQYCNLPQPKYYSQSDAVTAVSNAHSCNASVVYLDVDPNFWIDMVGAAQGSLYSPDWVGPGLTNGEDLVAAPVCGEAAGTHAAFLSPFPGLDKQPAGFQAESNPAPDTTPSSRDIEEDVYGVSEVVYYALLSLGSIQNLTRDNFIAAMSRFSGSYGPQFTVYRDVNFHGGHFGGLGMWEEQLNCSNQQYITAGTQGG